MTSYVFPNTAGLEKAKNDPSEFLYPGTIGSNRLFHILKLMAESQPTPRWDLYLINIYTLVRNAYKKGISQEKLEKLVDDDVDTFMTFIGAYLNYRRQTQGTVLFYAPDYRAIPSEYLRPITSQNVETDAMYKELRKKLPLKLTELTEDLSLRKFLVMTSGMTYPHKEIPGYLSMIYKGTRIYGSIGTVIITHCPIDLHLYSSIQKLELFESFTGNITPSLFFGKKLTKETIVPFIPTTHRLFGDEVHIAPLLKGKQRTEAIKLAVEHRWAIKTERDIINDVVLKFPSISKADLTRLRL